MGRLIRAGHLELKQDKPGLQPGTVVMVWVSSISQVCVCILRADPWPAGNAPCPQLCCFRAALLFTLLVKATLMSSFREEFEKLFSLEA